MEDYAGRSVGVGSITGQAGMAGMAGVCAYVFILVLPHPLSLIPSLTGHGFLLGEEVGGDGWGDEHWRGLV
jgi:hypothetical protein